jgi:superfamily II DNA/RNA helicase
MPPEITRLTQTFLSNPVRVEVARQATAAEGVEQRVVELKPGRKETADREKRAALRALIEAEGKAFKNAIIFCNRKRDVGVVFKSLEKHGYNAGALHGDLDQSVRTATLHAFRDDQIKLLVASDVAARGLDIPNVSHIFNFDVPTHAEDYVHRIGRTGRAGRSGTAITISMPADKKYIDAIEALIDKQIPRAEAPAGTAAAEDGARRDRPRRDRAEEPSEAVEATAVRMAPGEEEPSRERRGRRGRAEDKPERKADRKQGEANARERVVGMGDHVPAFLLRPVPVRRTTRETADQEADAAA